MVNQQVPHLTLPPCNTELIILSSMARISLAIALFTSQIMEMVFFDVYSVFVTMNLKQILSINLFVAQSC